MDGPTINPLKREPISEPLDVGIRSINGLLTVGRGQRLGLFAGTGVGKSVLLGMMTRLTKAEIIVVGLIGERGREVKNSSSTSWARRASSGRWSWPRRRTMRPCCACVRPCTAPASPNTFATRARTCSC